MHSRDLYQQRVNVAQGGFAAVSGSGDIHVHQTAPDYHFRRLDDDAAPFPIDFRRQPSLLLSWAHELVDFYGRERELETLADWRNEPDEFDVFLIHGQGGQGKTRLANQFAALSSAEGWTAITAHPHVGMSGFAERPESLPIGSSGRIVVVDYAERWPVPLLQGLLSDSRLHLGRTRIVLVARPAGRWWAQISRRLARDFKVRPGHLALEPLPEHSGDREAIFIAARDRFAAALGAGDVRGCEPPADWKSGASSLSIQMAALASVFAATRNETAPDDPGALSAYLLDREDDHWTNLHAEAGLRTRPDTMARTVYLASLAGPVGHEVATVLLTATGLAVPGEETNQLIDDHLVSYPATEPATVLVPLQPDRLAEDFIAIRSTGQAADAETADAWTNGKIDAALRALRDVSPDRALAMLSTTVAVAQRWESFSRNHLSRLLLAQPDAFLEGGGTILSALADVQDLDAATLADFEQTMPVDGSVDIMDPLATLTGRLYERLRQASPSAPGTIAVALRLAFRLVRAERYQEALDPARASVQFARGARLRRADADGHGPQGARHRRADAGGHGLAVGLGCLAEALEGLGRIDEAMTAADEAVRLWGPPTVGAAETNLVAAGALETFARLLYGREQSREAAVQQRRATGILTAHADQNIALLPRRARAFSALAQYCLSAGLDAEGGRATRAAVDLWRLVEEHIPGPYGIRLLDALTDLAQLDDAPISDRLAAAEEAGRELLKLVQHDVTLMPRVATTTRVWAELLSRSGNHRRAIDTVERALQASFDLKEQHLPTHARLRGRVLLTFAVCCLGANQGLDDGLKAAELASSEYFTSPECSALRSEADRTTADLLIKLGRFSEAERRFGRTNRRALNLDGIFERAATKVSRHDGRVEKACTMCGGTKRIPGSWVGKPEFNLVVCWSCELPPPRR
ncbi:hypothetical protein [Dactylosporangium sp. CS-033363]|uniref:hypothetical protein n=1 Tax=Dactylosporangium sp. CS-033363 TaxID=3239935 RepID=UPI003D93663E